MRNKLFLLLLLSGCTSQPITIEQINIDRSKLPHLNSLDTTMWVTEKKIPPEYPLAALRGGTQGCVNVEFIIDSDGRPKNARIVKKSSPHKVFDRTSLNTTAQFKFLPSAANSTRQPVITNNIFTFMVMEDYWNETKQEKVRLAWEEKCRI